MIGILLTGSTGCRGPVRVHVDIGRITIIHVAPDSEDCLLALKTMKKKDAELFCRGLNAETTKVGRRR